MVCNVFVVIDMLAGSDYPSYGNHYCSDAEQNKCYDRADKQLSGYDIGRQVSDIAWKD